MRGTLTEPEKRTLQAQAHGTEAQEEEKGKQRSGEQGQQKEEDRTNRTQQRCKSNRRLGSERKNSKMPPEEETRIRKSVGEGRATPHEPGERKERRRDA